MLESYRGTDRVTRVLESYRGTDRVTPVLEPYRGTYRVTGVLESYRKTDRVTRVLESNRKTDRVARVNCSPTGRGHPSIRLGTLGHWTITKYQTWDSRALDGYVAALACLLYFGWPLQRTGGGRTLLMEKSSLT